MSASPGIALAVVWHDVECGDYREDLALWRSLAGGGGGPVLDVGAGTGRVALDLAARGVPVVALDADAELLAALDARAGAAGLPVETVCADARAFDLGGRAFGLIVVPMQTLQLLGGPEGRSAFLRRARSHLAPGGLLAVALADALESFSAEIDGLPEPDLLEVDGVRYTSRPLAVVDEGDRAAIHRLREIEGPGGARAESHDVIRLDRVSAEELEAEAAALGFTPRPSHRIPATDVYVGSTVVMLGG
jgi:SAM-dependent methyltransferase